jgi:hypothetical protein
MDFEGLQTLFPELVFVGSAFDDQTELSESILIPLATFGQIR